MEKEDFTMHLQAIKDIHLDTGLPAGNLPISDPKYSYILGTIGAFDFDCCLYKFCNAYLSASQQNGLWKWVSGKRLAPKEGSLLFNSGARRFRLFWCR